MEEGNRDQYKDRAEVDDTLHDVKFSGISWLHNDGFYYSSYDKPKGSQLSEKTQIHKLFYHKLGTPQSEDKLIFGGEATPRRYIGGGVTEDEQFLVISAANATYGNELYIQDLTIPNAPIAPIVTVLIMSKVLCIPTMVCCTSRPTRMPQTASW